MKLKRKRKGEFVCPICKAIHYYHYAYCSRCNAKNRIPKKLTRRKRKTPKDYKEISRLVALVDSVRSVPGLNSKKNLLRTILKREPFLYRFLRTAFDPTVKLGFNAQDVKDTKPEFVYVSLWDILRSRIRQQSGPKLTAARIKGIMNIYPKEFREVIYDLISKKLKIGMKVKDVNQVLVSLKLQPIPVRRKHARFVKKKG